ncbi:MAG TPA: GlsB/YeaQ/YmgE family stress response membrane protein [Acidimicrobiales bacterium]|nr:GlsB/YeaQ/YmgE family stress response membrane protein [Acidimicrobiales bacterium]
MNATGALLAATHGGSLLWFLVFALIAGLIAGAVARLLVPGPTPMGCLGTALAGIAGSIIAAFVGRLLFGPAYAPGFIASVLGATLVVWLVTRSRYY